MEAASQIVASGLLTGVEYALAAVGMTLIFGVGRVLNLAHGGFFALGAYIAYQVALFGFPAFAGAIPAAAAGLVLGGVVERVLVRPVRGEPLAAAVVLLGLGILAEEGFRLVWGASLHSVPLRLPPISVGHIVLSAEQAGAVAIVVLTLGTMALYLRARPGLALRAVAADPEVAALAGIDVGRLHTVVFAAACGMAAAAGALLAPLLTISPTMGRVPMVLSLAMVIVGGPGRIWGTLVASLGVALASNIAAFYGAPAWSYVLALTLVMGTVLWRANGALGGKGPASRWGA
jgi:branched-chain amino acid transport system permease protein